MQGKMKTLCIWLVLGLVLVGLYTLTQERSPKTYREFEQFAEDVKQGRIDSIRNEGKQIHVNLFDGKPYYTIGVLDAELAHDLSQQNVPVSWEKKKNSPWVKALLSYFPILLLVGLFIYFLNKSAVCKRAMEPSLWRPPHE